jgi:hypothetical protein
MMKNPSGIIIHKIRKVNDEMSKHKMFIQLSNIREFYCKILREQTKARPVKEEYFLFNFLFINNNKYC